MIYEIPACDKLFGRKRLCGEAATMFVLLAAVLRVDMLTTVGAAVIADRTDPDLVAADPSSQGRHDAHGGAGCRLAATGARSEVTVFATPFREVISAGRLRRGARCWS
jgi:hypothetical protein